MSINSELIETWAEWLKPMPWDWFGTLTSPGYPSRAKVMSKFEQWVSDLGLECGTSQFRWVRIIERGAYEDNVHIHFLAGGLKEPTRRFPGIGRKRWEKIAGRAAIARFDPDKGGVYYLLKTLDPRRDLEIDFHFPEQHQKEAAHGLVMKQRSTPERTTAQSRKRSKNMRVYKGTLSLKSTTKSMVIYAHQDLRGQYIPKEMLRGVSGDGDNYPQELIFSLRTAIKKTESGSRRVPSVKSDPARATQ